MSDIQRRNFICPILFIRQFSRKLVNYYFRRGRKVCYLADVIFLNVTSDFSQSVGGDNVLSIIYENPVLINFVACRIRGIVLFHEYAVYKSARAVKMVRARGRKILNRQLRAIRETESGETLSSRVCIVVQGNGHEHDLVITGLSDVKPIERMLITYLEISARRLRDVCVREAEPCYTSQEEIHKSRSRISDFISNSCAVSAQVCARNFARHIARECIVRIGCEK